MRTRVLFVYPGRSGTAVLRGYLVSFHLAAIALGCRLLAVGSAANLAMPCRFAWSATVGECPGFGYVPMVHWACPIFRSPTYIMAQ